MSGEDSDSTSTSSNNDCSPRVSSFGFSTELSKENLEYVWDCAGQTNVEARDNGIDEAHTLSIDRAMLGNGAIEGEANVVELKTMLDRGDGTIESITITPLVYLKRGLKMWTNLTVLLQQDRVAKFTLVKGSGPLHLTGHIFHRPIRGEESEDEDEDESDESEGDTEEYTTDDDSDVDLGEPKNPRPDQVAALPEDAKTTVNGE